jgi:glycosyltransferase involved in cell wall biosynthesis
MNGATAVICPSLYMEPFCGVNVEAQLCGTPVITTDFGAFPETVEQGRTGFRCLVMQDYVNAIHQVKCLDRAYIQERALRLYSCEAVGKEFERWFQDLYNLWESAHLEGVKGWSRVEV